MSAIDVVDGSLADVPPERTGQLLIECAVVEEIKCRCQAHS
jgi:hypothetical protein